MLSVIKGLLSVAQYLTKWAADKQLLDAGEAKQIARHNQKALNLVQSSQNTRSNLTHTSDELSDDSNNRDD